MSRFSSCWQSGKPETSTARCPLARIDETRPRLRHPGLDFYVDVRRRPYTGGTWVATADLGGDHDIGMGREPREAIRGALGALGERYAREMARYAELEAGPSDP